MSFSILWPSTYLGLNHFSGSQDADAEVFPAGVYLGRAVSISSFWGVWKKQGWIKRHWSVVPLQQRSQLVLWEALDYGDP